MDIYTFIMVAVVFLLIIIVVFALLKEDVSHALRHYHELMEDFHRFRNERKDCVQDFDSGYLILKSSATSMPILALNSIPYPQPIWFRKGHAPEADYAQHVDVAGKGIVVKFFKQGSVKEVKVK